MTDSGYRSEANLKYLEKKKIEGFIATDKESYRDRQQPGPRGPLPQGATRVDRMRRKLQTKVERRFTPSVKQWWSQCLDRSNKRAASGNFSCVVCRRCKASGPWFV